MPPQPPETLQQKIGRAKTCHQKITVQIECLLEYLSADQNPALPRHARAGFPSVQPDPLFLEEPTIASGEAGVQKSDFHLRLLLAGQPTKMPVRILSLTNGILDPLLSKTKCALGGSRSITH